MTDALERLLRRQRHVLTRWQALQHMSLKTLRHRVESGRWQRLHPGVFVTRTGDVSPTQLAWAAVLAFGADRSPRGVGLSGLSALCAWGLTSVEPSRVQVLICAGRSRRAIPGVELHSGQPSVVIVEGPGARLPLTRPPQALIDAVAWARSDREARLIVAASFQQRLVWLPQVERLLAERPNVRRRALLWRTAVDCAGGSQSVGELDLLELCRAARLPEPRRQVCFRDSQGRLRFIDAIFDPWNVAVEIDGAHHLNVRQAWDDALRANTLELNGYTVLRYPAHAIRERHRRVAAEIRQALRAAGWRPNDHQAEPL